MTIQVKPIRIFTKENPVTKVELWNCFKATKGFIRRPVVETRGEIGLNAPKYLRKSGYADLITVGDIDYLVLTSAGQEWLKAGLARHLELHPEDTNTLIFPLVSDRKLVRHTRADQAA